jgi:hypothetical protein
MPGFPAGRWPTEPYHPSSQLPSTLGSDRTVKRGGNEEGPLGLALGDRRPPLRGFFRAEGGEDARLQIL